MMGEGNAGNGGSGYIVIRFPNTYNITIGAGLSTTQSTSGSDKIVQFHSGTDTISFASA
jgi:hypothetical protein